MGVYNPDNIGHWEIEALHCFIDGKEITDVVKAGYTNDREHTQIETARGIVGPNVKYARPTFTITVKSTCRELQHVIDTKNRRDDDYYNNGVVVVIQYDGHGGALGRKATFPNAWITKVAASFEEEAPDIDIEGWARNCIEEEI